MDFTIAHHIPGRLRLKSDRRIDDGLAATVRRVLAAQPGVRDVNVSGHSIVVNYAPDAISEAEIVELVEHAFSADKPRESRTAGDSAGDGGLVEVLEARVESVRASLSDSTGAGADRARDLRAARSARCVRRCARGRAERAGDRTSARTGPLTRRCRVQSERMPDTSWHTWPRAVALRRRQAT